MEIRDPVHGSIQILDEEIPIIQNVFFQRLRNLKQLGFSEYIFPGSTHTRFLHSIGVMNIAEKAFNRLFQNKLENKDFQRLKQTLKLGALLHDIGHAPLSHSTESVMPILKELKLPSYFSDRLDQDRQATHEDYTIKIIVDSSLSETFKLLEDKFGTKKECIADLVLGSTNEESYFTIDKINYFPILHQLISSEMDCDRMDYLLRDSYFCGVSYGNFDLDWLIDNLDICHINNKAYLGLSERAVVTFDDFLLSRFHMFLMVYFHYRSVCLEKLLIKYLKSTPSEYMIPSDINEYCEHDDHYLMKVMRNSKNSYAQAIVKNQIPEKIFESFNKDQLENLENIRQILEENNIDYIHSNSKGRLSKYYGHQESTADDYTLKVVRTSVQGKSYANINDATDLFEKFSKSHEVNRLHCDLSNLSKDIQDKIKKYQI